MCLFAINPLQRKKMIQDTSKCEQTMQCYDVKCIQLPETHYVFHHPNACSREYVPFALENFRNIHSENSLKCLSTRFHFCFMMLRKSFQRTRTHTQTYIPKTVAFTTC